MMANTLKEAPITTASARGRLPNGDHRRAIDKNVHLVYRRLRKAGEWHLRRYIGGVKYERAKIGLADDNLAADGVSVFSFDQACRRGLEIAHEQIRRDAKKDKPPAPHVRDIVSAYIDRRERREVGQKRDARSRLTKHVLSAPIADLTLDGVTASKLREWVSGLPADLAPTTVRRLVNDFKAALNDAAACDDGLFSSLSTEVRRGLKLPAGHHSVARQHQVLDEAAIRSVIAAAREVDALQDWDGDLARLVILLAATGARFSQVTRLTVGDLQAKERKVIIPNSRKGRGRQGAGAAWWLSPELVDELKPLIAGQPKDAPLLERWRKKQVSPTVWTRERRGPWSSASELTRPWAEIVHQAGIPKGTVPYALRHSSIVRALRNHLPTMLVAKLHNTSAKIIEDHYAAYISDALSEASAKLALSLV
jgi:integrase